MEKKFNAHCDNMGQVLQRVFDFYLFKKIFSE